MSHGEWNDLLGVFLPPVVMNKVSEPLVVLMKDLPEDIVQKTGLEKEPAAVSGVKLKTSKVRRQFCGSWCLWLLWKSMPWSREN